MGWLFCIYTLGLLSGALPFGASSLVVWFAIIGLGLLQHEETDGNRASRWLAAYPYRARRSQWQRFN